MQSLLNSHKQRPLHPSLQAKLQLLELIKKGDYKKVLQLSYALSKVGRTNPEIYQRLNNFVSQNQKGLIQMEQQERQLNDNEPIIENVDGDFVEGQEWDSDQDLQYNSSEDQEDQQTPIQSKINVPMGLFRDVLNNQKNRKTSNSKKIISSKIECKKIKPAFTQHKTENRQVFAQKSTCNSAITKSKNASQPLAKPLQKQLRESTKL